MGHPIQRHTGKPVRRSVSPFVYLYVYLSVWLSVYRSFCLTVCFTTKIIPEFSWESWEAYAGGGSSSILRWWPLSGCSSLLMTAAAPSPFSCISSSFTRHTKDVKVGTRVWPDIWPNYRISGIKYTPDIRYLDSFNIRYPPDIENGRISGPSLVGIYLLCSAQDIK